MNFNKDVDNHLKSIGFLPLISDPCLYQRTTPEGEHTIIAVYVDDLLIAGKNDKDIIHIKAQLKTKYSLKDFGAVDWYLGMRVTQDLDKHKMTLNQGKYCRDILTKFKDQFSIKPVKTPMDTNLNLTRNKIDKQSIDLSPKQKLKIANYPYRQVVGSLIYLSIYTRPDITFAVSKVAQFNATPTLDSIDACNRILQYLNCTSDEGLTYYKTKEQRINAYVDSDFSNCLITGKSTTGFIIYYGTCPIYWNTHLSEFGVAISTAEAEYQAACSCAKNIMAIRNLLEELNIGNKITLNAPITIYEDNESTIAMALQICSKSRTKYIISKVHYVRELQKQGYILLKHISTAYQTADTLTKGLAGPLFQQHKQYLMGHHTGQYEIMYNHKQSI